MTTKETAQKLEELRALTGVSRMLCEKALELRGGDVDLAEEWLTRYSLAVVMPDSLRYPKWTAAQEAKVEDVETQRRVGATDGRKETMT